jgi:hypothetical protein
MNMNILDLETVRNVLVWCSIINIGLLLFSFLMMIVMRRTIYKMHSKWFAMTNEQFDMMWYGLLGFYKICIFAFNIVPCIALSILL